MSGSTYGTLFSITSWGESHGAAIGVTIDGCPAGLDLSEEDIQVYLNRRKPGQSKFTTARKETDQVEILSGVFEGQTTGTSISLMVRNQDQHSKDYSNIRNTYRPGHADYSFDEKYGFRDYRGGGRSSGRETIGRVAAGAVALKILESLGIKVNAYTKSIGNIVIPNQDYHLDQVHQNPLYMPNNDYAKEASAYLEECIKEQNSSGGIIECVATGMPAGIGDPVFNKLDARLASSIMSIGAVKGVEIGDGFSVATSTGKSNNDPFIIDQGQVSKKSNHAGGILGGISDGSPIILRAAIKPTPSISSPQETISKNHEPTSIAIHGRHDPVIVPRAVVVVEAMTALTLVDLLFTNMSARMDHIIHFYKGEPT